MRTQSKIILCSVLSFACLCFSCCRTVPAVVVEGTGQIDAGNAALGDGEKHIDNARQSNNDVENDISAAGQRETDRTASLDGQATEIGRGSETVAGLLERCEELIRQSAEELHRYADATQGCDKGSGQVAQ